MPEAFTYDVFLSHNSADKPRVRRLAERPPQLGTRNSELGIARLCLSPVALGSDWVGLERSTVLFRDPANAGRRFIPFLLADCKLPDSLRRFKYVDYRQRADAAYDEPLTG